MPKEQRTALFPGTFDPPSLGHLNIIQRALSICDRLIVAIAYNPDKEKTGHFSLEEKLEMLRAITKRYPKVEVTSFQGLTAEFAKQHQIHFLIRGVRNLADVATEFQMASANRYLGSIETLFLMAEERYSYVSSSLIRTIANLGGPIAEFVPKEVEELIRKNRGRP